VYIFVIRHLRLISILMYFGVGAVLFLMLFPLLPLTRRQYYMARWAQCALRIVGVRLVHQAQFSQLGEAARFVVANHISWLDILLLYSVLPIRFVAKVEIRGWPVVGRLSQLLGTVFIFRESLRDMTRVNRELVAIFPEGATTDGLQMQPFHPGLLQSAIVAQVPIQPVAIRYLRLDGSICAEAAYDGDKTLWQTLQGVCAQQQVLAQITFTDLVLPAAQHRRELAVMTHQKITDHLS
jgi:1-acyl-sn-glycerol-3-phosphate acyltransferase